MGGTDLELAKAIGAAAGDCRVTIAGGVTTAEEIAALDAWAATPRSAWRSTPAGSTSPTRFMAPLVDRPRRRALADRRGRRARHGAGPGLLATGIDPRGGASAARASTSPARAACGSRARPPAPRRSCCASTSTATATARASSCASSRRASAISDTRTCWGEDQGLGALARTPRARAAQAGAGRQLHGQAVRRPGAARRQAARGGGRAGRGRRRAST